MQDMQKKRRAFFLDRDGTLNVYKGYIRRAADIELCPGVTEAVSRIHQSGYLAIVITNQPVIARGEASFAEVDRMTDRLQQLLMEGGTFLDDCFYCPHHPDRGFAGEIPELKIKCGCRKPEPGLLYQAASKYNIDLKKSFMAGDSTRDVQAGQNAGCTSFLLNDHKGNHYDYENLLECVKAVLE